MEMINDELLDSLLDEASMRQMTVNQINDNVVKALRKESWKSKYKRMMRLLAFCLGVPFLLLLPLSVYHYIGNTQFPLVTIAVTVGLLFFYIPIVMRLNEVFKQPIV